MLEEWSWDPALLASFARHYQTDEPIPADLVRQLERATGFGRALDMRTQMAYARISLSLYDRPPAQVNTDSIVSAVLAAVHAVPADAGHPHAGVVHPSQRVFGVLLHLHVVAGDREGSVQRVRPRRTCSRRDPARRYRAAILEPGGSAPAAVLVEDFLGRPFSFDAWRQLAGRAAERDERPDAASSAQRVAGRRANPGRRAAIRAVEAPGPAGAREVERDHEREQHDVEALLPGRHPLRGQAVVRSPAASPTSDATPVNSPSVSPSPTTVSPHAVRCANSSRCGQHRVLEEVLVEQDRVLRRLLRRRSWASTLIHRSETAGTGSTPPSITRLIFVISAFTK